MQRRASPAQDPERRHHDHELIGLGLRQLLEIEVLDDENAGIRDYPHVDRKHLRLPVCDSDGRPLLERQCVVADHARSVADEVVRGIEPGPRGERAVVDRLAALEVLPPTGSNEYRIALFESYPL